LIIALLGLVQTEVQILPGGYCRVKPKKLWFTEDPVCRPGVPARLFRWPPPRKSQLPRSSGTSRTRAAPILPGAEVTARNVDTGLTRTVITGEDGAYRLEFLPVGAYVLEVTANGLQKTTRSGIVLQINDTVRVDVTLTVGKVTETVTVTEAPLAVNTSTVEIGRTIQSAEITSLPLVDRNVYTLLDLTPGVQSNNNGVAAASTGTSSLILGFPDSVP
jgi:hypothetical protein